MAATEHYGQIANNYDTNYADTNAATLELVLRKLNLKPDDMVVDVGAGTGYLAHQMWKSVGLKQPVVCVEPSEDMLSEAKLREGVTPILATAEKFFNTQHMGTSKHKFTKVLMCSCVHHFSDPQLVFSGLADHLTEDKLCLILTRPSETTLPFFKAALRSFAQSCPDVARLLSLLQSLGFTTEVTTEVMQFQLQKQQWYKMLRERYMSHLEEFSEEEVEEGIEELEEGVFSGVEDPQLITINDSMVTIVAKLQ